MHQCSELLPDTCDASPPFKSGHGSQGSDEQNHGWNGLLSYFFENPHFIQHVKEKLSVLPLPGYYQEFVNFVPSILLSGYDTTQQFSVISRVASKTIDCMAYFLSQT